MNIRSSQSKLLYLTNMQGMLTRWSILCIRITSGSVFERPDSNHMAWKVIQIDVDTMIRSVHPLSSRHPSTRMCVQVSMHYLPSYFAFRNAFFHGTVVVSFLPASIFACLLWCGFYSLPYKIKALALWFVVAVRLQYRSLNRPARDCNAAVPYHSVTLPYCLFSLVRINID